MARHIQVGYSLDHGLPPTEKENDFIINMREMPGIADPYRILMQKAEAAKELVQRAEDVTKQWRRLRKILGAYEAVIRKRWEKKSKSKRREMLLKISPSIALGHAPEFDSLRAHSKRGFDIKYKSQPTKNLCVPHINLEDLSQGMFLPLFLNSRGRHAPHLFAHADMYAMHFVLNMFQLLEAKVLHGSEPWNCAVLFKNLELGSYVRLTEKRNRVHEVLASGQGFVPGSALLILGAQSLNYNFLVASCLEILHDIPTLLGANHQFNMVPEPEPITASSSQRLNSLFAAIEAPYRPPARIDFERIEDLLEAKHAAAEDHIWSLKEDPSYFEELFEEKVSRQHHCRTTATPPEAYEAIKIIGGAYEALLFWHSLREDFRTLKNLKEKHSALITPEKQLPHEYEKAFLCFWDNLGRVSDKLRRRDLNQALIFSPAYRKYITYYNMVSDKAVIMAAESGKNDPVYFLLREMAQNRMILLYSLPDFFDELERSLISSPSDRDRLSILELSVLSDIGIVAQITREIYLYQPWASKVDQQLKTDGGVIRAITDSKWKRMTQVLENLKGLSFSELAKLLVDPKCFDYPAQKRQSLVNNQRMRQAEKVLDNVWNFVNQAYLTASGQATLFDAHQDLFSDKRKLLRTPEWVAPPPKVKRPSKQRTPIDEDLLSSFEHVRIEEAKAIKPSSSIPLKCKTKTRKEQPTPGAAILAEEIPEETETKVPREVIRVSKRIYRVFTALFYTPSENDPPGEIAWQDFLQAMAAGGLTAEPLYGSIWHFTPQDGNSNNIKRSIQFHQPHPGKIRFETARYIGRRLDRAFGWGIDLFALE